MGSNPSDGLGGVAGQPNAGEGEGREGGGLREAETTDTATAPSEVETLTHQVAELQQAHDSKVAYARSLEDQIDRLHRELQTHRTGESERASRNMLTELIGLYDDLVSLIAANDFSAAPAIKSSLESFRKSIIETLKRNDVDAYSVDGDVYDANLQKPIVVTPTTDQALDKHVRAHLRVGFRTADRILRQEYVDVFSYQPA